MTELPNLAGVATQSLVETLGGGSFKASYINWARTVQLLREHAPGWLPELVRTGDGGLLHRAPVGAYLLIRFKHADGTVTTEVPQAIMDTKNNSVPLDKITARDVTDTHRRGVCMAAAFTFGLAYELWAKMPLETGYAVEEKPPAEAKKFPSPVTSSLEGETFDEATIGTINKIASALVDLVNDDGADRDKQAYAIWELVEPLENAEKLLLWSVLAPHSKVRARVKVVSDEMRKKAA